MTDFMNALKAANEHRWAAVKITPNRSAEVFSVAKRLAAPTAKARYQEIAAAVWGRPDLWYVVAIIHEREASQRWDRQLGQGDPLSQVSTHRPAGRGPFHDHDGHTAFYWGALDALNNCPPFAGRWKDWSIGGVLTLWILYNGTGYELYHHEASPYDWGATNQEQRGKYTSDGHFDPSAWDTQVGCAAMLLAMMALDPTITFTGAVITAPPAPKPVVPVAVPVPAAIPAPTAPPAAPSFWQPIFNALKRKP